jgi:2-acylglycerol O-acyltransferase 2
VNLAKTFFRREARTTVSKPYACRCSLKLIVDVEGMGRAITIVVGGATESLDAQPYSMRLVLKKRKGFVKMALRTGADLVPVLAFGENDLYDQVTSTSHPGIHKAQLLIKKLLGFTVPLFHARGLFNYDIGLMPYRRPLNIVVGRPIRVTQSLKPDQEEIDRLHEQYVRELESIWDSWKDDFANDRKGELELLE